MTRTRKPLATLISWAPAILSVCLAACASAPKENFYTLRPLPKADNASGRTSITPQQSTEFSVVVGPASVPAGADRQQWVVRRSATQVQVLDQQMWAQSLSSDIAEAVAEHLNQSQQSQAPSPSATSPAWRAYAETSAAQPLFARKPTLRVHLDVLRFESLLAPAPGIDDQLQWTLSCAARLAEGKQRTQRVGFFTTASQASAQDLLPTTASTADKNSTVYDRLAAAHALAVGRASLDIAAAVSALIAQCPKP